MAVDPQAPLVIFSGDSHIGPLLSQMRQYCPKEHLEAFDEYDAAYTKFYEATFKIMTDKNNATLSVEPAKMVPLREANVRTDGHHDVHTRLREMDRDGIASEVVFHGSGNGGPIPFVPAGTDFFPYGDGADLEMMTLGTHIYNQWLADFVATAPDRLVGAAHIPIWNIEESVEEVKWAKAAGLQTINFPSPRANLPEYDYPDWEPLWDAIDEAGMPLSTHTGYGDRSVYTGRQAAAVMFTEVGGWPPRRGLGRMIFGGVFERHPGIKLVITESPGAWWKFYEQEFDSSWTLCRNEVSDVCPKPPSEYMRANVYHANSFMAHFEAEEAVEKGYSDRVIWGRDYPHPEGTWIWHEDETQSSGTLESLRFCFAGLPPDDVARMVGETGAEVYGIDPDKLAAIAAEINAPTLEQLMEPLDVIPEDGGLMAFRTVGAWA